MLAVVLLALIMLTELVWWSVALRMLALRGGVDHAAGRNDVICGVADDGDIVVSIGGVSYVGVDVDAFAVTGVVYGVGIVDVGVAGVVVVARVDGVVVVGHGVDGGYVPNVVVVMNVGDHGGAGGGVAASVVYMGGADVGVNIVAGDGTVALK